MHIGFSNLLIRMKSPSNGFLQTFVSSLKRWEVDMALACNCRPVSLTCVSCKLLEYLGCSNIMARLEEYQLLSDRQHAFRRRHSCEIQLTTVIHDCVKILDKGQVDTFLLDFEKVIRRPTYGPNKYMFLPLWKLRARVGSCKLAPLHPPPPPAPPIPPPPCNS